MKNVIEMQKLYGLHKILMSRRKTFDVIIHRINFDIMDKRIIISIIIVFLLENLRIKVFLVGLVVRLQGDN